MRISDRLVVQYLPNMDTGDVEIVFVDEDSSEEHLMLASRIPKLARDIAEHQNNSDSSFGLGDVTIYREDYPGVSFALGYFWRSIQISNP